MAYIKIVDEDEDTSYDFLDEPADVIEGMQATIDFQEQRILQLESKIKELEYIVNRLDKESRDNVRC